MKRKEGRLRPPLFAFVAGTNFLVDQQMHKTPCAIAQQHGSCLGRKSVTQAAHTAQAARLSHIVGIGLRAGNLRGQR